jgi:hypothetical protein
MKHKLINLSLITLVVIGIIACGQKKYASQIEDDNMQSRNSQMKDIAAVEKELVKLYENREYDQFDKNFIYLLLSNTLTIDYPFQKLVDNNIISIATSKDSRLRFYNLLHDKFFNNNFYIFTDVFQFKSNENIQTCILSPIFSTEEIAYHYDKIFTVIIDSIPHYLLCSDSYDGVDYCYKNVKAFIIDEATGKLKDVAIFKPNYSKEPLSEVESRFYAESFGEFAYDEKEHILYLPIEKNRTNELFQLKENYFEDIGTCLPYKLHSSIATFLRNKLEFETEKSHVRIDEMKNGQYRYTSWSKDKSMADKPDLIIVYGYLTNGYVFYNEGDCYIIRNEEYNNQLIIKQGDKEEVLNEKMSTNLNF